jgi:hypothetical protein
MNHEIGRLKARVVAVNVTTPPAGLRQPERVQCRLQTHQRPGPTGDEGCGVGPLAFTNLRSTTCHFDGSPAIHSPDEEVVLFKKDRP